MRLLVKDLYLIDTKGFKALSISQERVIGFKKVNVIYIEFETKKYAVYVNSNSVIANKVHKTLLNRLTAKQDHYVLQMEGIEKINLGNPKESIFLQKKYKRILKALQQSQNRTLFKGLFLL